MERKEPGEFKWPETELITPIAYASPPSTRSSTSGIVPTSTPAASATTMTGIIRCGDLYLLDHYIERISREGHIECLEKNKVAIEAKGPEGSGFGYSLTSTAYLIKYKKSGIVASVQPAARERKVQWRVSYKTHETQTREVEKASQVIPILEEIKNLKLKYKSKAASLTEEDVSELAELLAKNAAA